MMEPIRPQQAFRIAGAVRNIGIAGKAGGFTRHCSTIRSRHSCSDRLPLGQTTESSTRLPRVVFAKAGTRELSAKPQIAVTQLWRGPASESGAGLRQTRLCLAWAAFLMFSTHSRAGHPRKPVAVSNGHR